MSIVRQIPLWLVLLAISACTSTPQRETAPVDWQTRATELGGLHHWTASGKLALRTKDMSESASMIWRQQDDRTRVQLSGPLGVGATTLESDGLSLEIYRDGERQTIDISTPEAIAANTGWDLPLQALSHWLKGLPSPDSEVQSLDIDPQTELARSLTQENWVVDFTQYGHFDAFTVPTRLVVQRGATRAKVIISNWRFDPN